MKSFFLLALVLVSSQASADWKQYYFQRLHQKSVVDADPMPPAAFDQLVNHNDPTDLRTYKQRYFVDSRYAENKQSPVIFYLCGEATCSANDLRGAVEEHARKFKAHLIALEHRYYGESQPFETLSPENLKLLTTEQALKDAARFQQHAKALLGLTGKWVVVGGSYPGSLSAYYRERYPDMVVGSLASSAPVMARDNFEEYDLHVASVAGSECASQMRKVVAQAEEALGDPEKLKALKAKFEASVLEDKDDFLYLIADMGALAVQYGYRDRFCKLLQGENPLEGYATFTRQIFVEWGMTAESMSAQGAISEDPAKYVDGFGMRQWFYQSCTEYGYWQNAYHDAAISVRSQRISPEYHRNLCRRLFKIEEPVNADATNERFYKPLLDASTSRILFTNGSQDPWSNLSIMKINGNDLNPNLTLVTIEKSAHCDDLRPSRPGDSAALKAARTTFQELIAEWLK